MAENILLESEKQAIRQEIINLFGEEGSSMLAFDLQSYKASVDAVISEMELEEYSYIDYWSGEPIVVTRKKMSQSVLRKNFLAMKGFLLIFKFRGYLFGSAIDYRYYYTDDQGTVQSRSFGEMDLLDLTIFSGSGIQLDINAIKNKTNEGSMFFQSKMNQYINIYTSPEKNEYMQKRDPSRYNLRIVRRNIMNRYYNQNPGLKTKDGLRYQTFNMGHIYESLDITLIDAFMQHGEEQMDSYIDNYMFGKYLKRDSVLASKGGDNFLTNTSIKSNQANLYSFKTIANQLYLIQQMLLMTNKATLKQEIMNLFIDQSDKSSYIMQDLENSANKAVDKIWSQIAKIVET